MRRAGQANAMPDALRRGATERQNKLQRAQVACDELEKSADVRYKQICDVNDYVRMLGALGGRTGSEAGPSSTSAHQPTMRDASMPNERCSDQISRGSDTDMRRRVRHIMSRGVQRRRGFRVPKGSHAAEMLWVQPAAWLIACQRLVDAWARPRTCIRVMVGYRNMSEGRPRARPEISVSQ